LALTKAFKKVYYYTRFDCKGFASPNNAYPGFGFEEIEVVPYMFAYSTKENEYSFDKVDLFCFFDLYYGDIQEHLKRLGKRVWGSGTGEKLELDRQFFEKTLIKYDLPVVPYKRIKGIENLREHLKNVKDKYVKLSKYREIQETFHHEDYFLTKPILDRLQVKLSPFMYTKDMNAYDIEFIVQDSINAIVEYGYDGYVVNGDYPKKSMFGVEIKDCAFLMKHMDYYDLPKPLLEINSEFSDYFKKVGYNGHFSTEIRGVSKNKGYFTDPTCFSKDTEVLTDNGWKFFYELGNRDRVCTLNPENNNIEYHKPINYFEYNFNGDMVLLTNKAKTVECLITPDHNVWHYNRLKKNLKCTKAKDLKDRIYIPRTGNWIGEDTKYFVLPEYHNEWDSGMDHQIHKVKHCEPKSILMEDWLRFLALYLSDGSIRVKSNHQTSIAQFDKIEEYESVLAKLPFEYSRNEGGFTISDVQLTTYLKQFGKCNEKFIPSFIKSLSSRLINVFLEAYTLADGSKRPDRVSPNIFFTTSKQLADDLQELIFKTGKVGYISRKNTAGTTMVAPIGKTKDYVRNYDGYVISERTKYIDFYVDVTGKRSKDYVKKIAYNDKVYDVEVPNHILYVRRNGKPFWSGNCRLPSPPSELYQEFISNWPEIIWHGSEGVLVEPEYTAKYAGEAIMTSEWLSDDNWQPISFPEKIKKNVKLRYACKIGKDYYCIPQGFPEVGAIVATGDSVEEVTSKLSEIADQIKGYDIKIKTDKLKDASEAVKKMEILGVKF